MLSEKEGIGFNSFLHSPPEMGFLCIYLIDFKMHRDGKGANPREHR